MIISGVELPDTPANSPVAVCIVGSGPAGITLACELDRCNFRVLLLESGTITSGTSPVEDYAGKSVLPHPDTTAYRRASLGGTSSIWGGRCVPLDPIDFEVRDYIRHSGWPIPYREIAQYYPRALDYCDAGNNEFTVQGSLKNAPPTFPSKNDNEALITDRIERYSLPTNFGRKYRRQLEKSVNVTVVLQARCVAVVKSRDADRIDAVTVIDNKGRRITLNAVHIVLATGGIEVPRILLNSNDDGPAFGNRYGCLGRYYSCHFENTIGKVVATNTRIPFKFEKTQDGVYSRRKLQFSPASQRQHRLLNTAFRFHFPDYANASHGSAVLSTIFLAKSAVIPEYRAILNHNHGADAPSGALPHLKNIAKGFPEVVGFGAQWLFQRKLARRKLPYTLVANADGSFPLEFNCEQTPSKDSRVLLSRERDRHGMRRVDVRWHIEPGDIEATYRGFMVLRDALFKSGACRLLVDEASLREQIAASVPLGGHHIGTARMSATERDGVVDSNCAVHDLQNLFIASSAVFPTSGHANPTLTIVALSIRLADHLKVLLDRGNRPLKQTFEFVDFSRNVM